MIRATEKEKKYQIIMLKELHKGNEGKSEEVLRKVQESAIQNQNILLMKLHLMLMLHNDI